MDVKRNDENVIKCGFAAMPNGKRYGGNFTLLIVGIILIMFMQAAGALEPVPMAQNSFLDLSDDAESAANDNRILMVMFEQEGCVYCEKLRRVNFSDKAIVDLIKSDFYLIQIDIWGERDVVDFTGDVVKEKDFAKKHNVQLTPMTMFFDGDGKILHKMTGYYKPDKFYSSLKYVSEEQYKKQSFKTYWAKTGKTKVDYKIIDAPFSVKAEGLKQALEKSGREKKGLVVLFEQDECVECLAMHSGILSDKDSLGLLLKNYDLMQLNVWGKKAVADFDGRKMTEAELSDKYKISYTPTLLFFDKAGNELFRVASYRATEHLKLLVEYLSEDSVSSEGSFQEWLRYRH